MTLMLALAIGVLVGVGALQLLQRDAIRIVLGLYLAWHALNLLILGVATVRGTRAPFADEGTGPMTDPLVQALVLTAIVISLGFIAFLLVLLFWLALHRHSIDTEDFREGQK